MTDKPKWTDLFGIDPDYLEGVPEEPKYTETDMRVLTEAALRLGRKEAGEDVFQLLTAMSDEVGDGEQREMFHDLALMARSIATQPSPDSTTARTDASGYSDLPQDSQAGRGPQMEDQA